MGDDIISLNQMEREGKKEEKTDSHHKGKQNKKYSEKDKVRKRQKEIEGYNNM